MRLFHFSEQGDIEAFAPRRVLTPSKRPAGKEWLNGPLVWAIDELRQPMYLFPRDCPRILVWPTAQTTEADLRDHGPVSGARMIAYIEEAWRERHGAGVIHRYELPAEGFEDLVDAGMWVSRSTVRPLRVDRIDDLPAALAEQKVELRYVERLAPLRRLWQTTLHVSGVRLRNAADWPG